MAGICYSIRKNRIESGLTVGFTLQEDGTLTMDESQARHILYLRALDCATLDGTWGRISFEADYSENMTCYVYAKALNESMFYRSDYPKNIDDFLCDPEEGYEIKREFLERVEAKKHVNKNDILLYEQTGRYLYLVIEFVGEGSGWLRNIRVDRRGDSFMQTFPEIYHARGEFFHRYLSIFSSIYTDFQQDIESLPDLLDIDKCPIQLLTTYGSWLGIDLACDIQSEQILRTLVREAYELNKIKGTKKAISRIAEIMLGEEVLILEHNIMKDYLSDREDITALYGNSIYDVIMLVDHPVSELEKSQLMYVLNQFKPLRSRIHIVHLKSDGVLDSHSYLDMNARVFEVENAGLDESQVMDGVVTLK